MHRLFKTSKGNKRTQSLKLPLEILCKIVDEVYAAQYNTGAGNPLKSLSQTCRALAIYCRPLAFRSIAIHSFPPGSRYSISPTLPAGVPVVTIRAFTKLIEWHSQLSNAVAHLHLDTRIQLPSKTSSLLKINHFPKQDWLLLFTRNFGQLRALKISFRALQHIPEDVLSAMLQFLSKANGLESLTLEAFANCAIPVLDFVPVSVKDLTIDLRGYGANTRLPSVVSKRASLPRLDSLTVSYYMHFEVIRANETGQTFPIDLTNLSHLELPIPRMADAVNELRFFRALILPSAHTLQCIHISYPSVYSDNNGLLLPIQLDTLPNLQCLEVCAYWRRTTLSPALTWLSNSVLTPTSIHASQELKVSVLGILSRREDVTKHFTLWEEMCLEDRWPNLRLVTVAGFAAFAASHFPEHAFVDVVPLWVYGGGEVKEYQSLWEGCPCSGWRSR
ncbi:hypothetical protein BKA70DRAFT_1218459 [Coprinopsis sp. MPI-PUGE-AT-0042]|nr:hypothetical protein BKA70DRAFT_1218459 [Coprinopsis sp. MPI-PUGE-AT-0042]